PLHDALPIFRLASTPSHLAGEALSLRTSYVERHSEPRRVDTFGYCIIRGSHLKKMRRRRLLPAGGKHEMRRELWVALFEHQFNWQAIAYMHVLTKPFLHSRDISSVHPDMRRSRPLE